jgi:hypothetical protein
MKNEQITAKTAKESISNTDMMFAVTFDGTVIAMFMGAEDAQDFKTRYDKKNSAYAQLTAIAEILQ